MDPSNVSSHSKGIVADHSTPARLGYRWPAEWEPHAATWLAWPHKQKTWPGRFASIPATFARIIRTLAQYEPIHVLAGGTAVMEVARRHVENVPNVELWDIPTNDCWTRDYGPTFLGVSASSPAALVDWQYNAWGGKYPPFNLDNDAPQQIAQRIGHRRFAAPLVLEGGAIDGNGRGTVLVNEPCIRNANRNPGVSRDDVATLFQQFLQTRNLLWIENGWLEGDDTDGHIDQLARFVGPRTVVVAACQQKDDSNARPLQAVAGQLASMTDQDGAALDIVSLPLPSPRYHDGRRLPASYCNFYVANGVVLVPEFGDAADAPAMELLGSLFPGREMIGLDTQDLVWGLGGLHCVTQQQPF